MTETGNNNKTLLTADKISEAGIVENLLELVAIGEIPARTQNEALKAIRDANTGTANRTAITNLAKELVTAMESGEGSKLVAARKNMISQVAKLAGVTDISAKPGEAPIEFQGTPEIADDGSVVENLTTGTNKEIGQLLGMMMSVKHGHWEKPSDRPAITADLNKRLQKSVSELKTLQQTEKRVNKPIQDLLNKLVKQKKLTREEAKSLLELHPDQEDFEKILHEIIAPFLTGNDNATADAIRKTITKDAGQRKQIDEALRAKIVEYRKIMNEIGEDLNTEAARHFELQRLGRYVGFDIKAGKVLRVKDRRKKLEKKQIQGGKTVWVEVKDSKGNFLYENIYRTATIKKVTYSDLNYQDKDGNPVKIPSNDPLVEVEYIDETPDERGIKNKLTEEYPASTLKQLADENEITEVITPVNETDDMSGELSQLAQLIGREIKQGDELEYTSHAYGEENKAGTPKTVQVVGFTKKKDDYATDNQKTYVELSNPVVTGSEPTTELKKILSLEEFVRWYKRVNASEKMDLQLLRSRLQQEFAERNSTYPDRDPNMYPPITVEPGELLYYDKGDASPPTYLIKNVSEEGIEFDNKEILSPTAFFKWVKDNHVEKKTAKSEAAKKAALITDPVKKMKVQELEEQIKEREIADEKLKREEANAVHPSTTETSPPPSNFIRKLYNETYFVRGGDIYEIGKEIFEYIKRYMDRTGKERVGKVGDMMLSPIHRQLGAEFQTLATSAETENVNRYKEQYSNFGVYQLYDRLSRTGNVDELKAILYTLADKGAIRWEDQTVIDAINRVGVAKSGYTHIPNYNEELIGKNLDMFWGEQTFNELKTKNNSSYGSVKSSFQEEARRLENDPEHKGGLVVKMRQMLFQHMKGEWVDPAEYEGYLHYAIQAGKLTFSDKVYFLFMGLGAMSPDGDPYSGKPLLNFARMSDLEGQLLNNFPIIDYFTTSKVQEYDKDGNMVLDEKGKPSKKAMNIHYVHKIMRDHVFNSLSKNRIESPADLKPPEDFIRYVERDMLMNEDVIVRMAQKASGNMSNWDHDDFHMFASRLGESQMENVATPGAAKQASIAGVKNTFVGINHYTNIFMEEFMTAQATGNKKEADINLTNMVNTVRSFVRLEAILDTRYYHTIHDRMRLTNELDSFAGVDGERDRTVRDFNYEMRGFVDGMIDQMKGINPAALAAVNADPSMFANLEQEWEIVKSNYGATQEAQQRRQQEAVKNFGRDFSSAIGIAQSAIGNEGIVRMIEAVQFKKDGTRLVKGLKKREEGKDDGTVNKTAQLEKPNPESFKTQLNAIENLRRELASTGGKTEAQINAEKDARTEAVMKAIREGKTEGLSHDDSALLNRLIDKLNEQLHPGSTRAPATPSGTGTGGTGTGGTYP